MPAKNDADKKKMRGWHIVYQSVAVDKEDPSKGKYELPKHELIKRALGKLFPKKYSFQLENNGNDHYQINVILEEPLSGSTIRSRMKSVLRNYWHAGCMTTQILHSQTASDVYCQKPETRVAGPWTFPFGNIGYYGQDLVPLKNYRPWQRTIVAKCRKRYVHPRSIYVIVDPEGNTGKSELSKYLCFKLDALLIPTGLTASQIKSAIAGEHARKNYLIDLPRQSSTKDNLQSLLSVVEDIKKGHVTSPFYGRMSTLFMKRPNVFIFTNSHIDVRMMSKDQWVIYEIDRENMSLRHIDTEVLFLQQQRTRMANRAAKKRNLDDIKKKREQEE